MKILHYTVYEIATGKIVQHTMAKSVADELPEVDEGFAVFKSKPEEQLSGKQDRVIIEDGIPKFKKDYAPPEIFPVIWKLIRIWRNIFEEERPILTIYGSLDVRFRGLMRMQAYIDNFNSSDIIDWRVEDGSYIALEVKDLATLHKDLSIYKTARMKVLHAQARIWRETEIYPTEEQLEDYSYWIANAGDTLTKNKSALITE